MEEKKVAAHIIGGIGNQLYIVATLISFAKKNNYTPIFDDRFISEPHTKDMDPKNPPTKNIFELYPKLSQFIKNDRLDNGFIVYQENEKIYQEIPVLGNQMLIKGYFQHYLYFDHFLIRNIFDDWLKDDPSDDIVIHIRRGKDYYNNSHIWNILEPNYFLKALELFPLGNITIVSEDLDWCRHNVGVKIVERVVTYRNDDIVGDLKILANAKKGLIIVNSTFSWWAAFLSKNNPKIVFPKVWWNPTFQAQKEKQYYIEGWIPFDPREEIFNMSMQDNLRASDKYLECYEYSKKFESNIKLDNNGLLNYYNNMLIVTWYLNKRHECFEYAEKIYKLWEEFHLPINKIVRQNVRFPLGDKYDISIDLTKIPCVVIALPDHIDRKNQIKTSLNKHGIEPIFSDGIRGLPTVLMNIGQAHINAINMGLKLSDKFLIFEEDFELTDKFKTKFVLPPMTDSFFLGHSSLGIHNYCFNNNGFSNIKYHEDSMQYYRIINMFGLHGVLYLNKFYSNKVIDLMELCKRIDKPCDVATAHLQESTNILTTNEPWCFQKNNIGDHDNQNLTKVNLF